MLDGISKKEIKESIENDTEVEDTVLDYVIRRLEEEQDKQKFWTKSEKGVV